VASDTELGLGSAGIWTELLDTKPEKWLDLVGDQRAALEDWRPADQPEGAVV